MAKTTTTHVRRLAAANGIELELEKAYRVYTVMAWAPDGKLFTSNGAHCYALEGHGYYTTPDWAATLADLQDLVGHGVEDCDTPDCDSCGSRV